MATIDAGQLNTKMAIINEVQVEEKRILTRCWDLPDKVNHIPKVKLIFLLIFEAR